MHNEGFEDNDDSRGFEEVLYDPPSGCDYDTDKIHKQTYR